MDTFSVSPEFCLIIKAFNESKSLREAASKLNMDPAGLTRKAQHIASEHGFLQKVNNRWIVTARGLDLVGWVEASIQSQKKLLHFKSSLRIASTMWMSEEVLIPGLSQLKNMIKADLSLAVPDQGFERSLLDGTADFVVVCHPPENPEIEHRVLYAEEWVIIAPKAWSAIAKSHKQDVVQLLQKKPFIRHTQMNPDLFLPGMNELLQPEIQIDNLIGIRSAVTEGLGWSLVPRLLVKRHFESRTLIEVPYEIPVKDRHVCLWWLRNRMESKRKSQTLATWLKGILSSRESV